VALPPPASFADHYLTSGYSVFPQEHRRGGTRDLTVLRVQQGTHEFSDPPVPELIVCAAVKADMRYAWDIGDGWTAEQHVTGGWLHVLPPDCHAQMRAVGPQEMIFVTLPVDHLDAMLALSGVSVDALVEGNTTYFHDPHAVRLVEALWRESRGSDAGANLQVDGLTLSLLARLLAHGRRRLRQDGSRIDATELARVIDYIEAHLPEALRLNELAAIAGRSRFAFARAFKAQTGLTPHHYVVSRRMARARELLRTTELSLAEIAYACGFSSQSHMTDTFRTTLQTTPGRYRTRLD
jgi:AraC family transcriptional regulator